MHVRTKNYRKRFCPICLSRKSKILYTQKFSDGLIHNIVNCSVCGFGYVNNCETQSEYNKYYKKMSKYELERDANLHRKYLNIIRNISPKSSSIIDIGCSTGHLLYLLKKAGYKNIHGVDPSPTCKEIAKNKYGLSITASDLYAYRSNKKYDVIIFTAVLEHLNDVQGAIMKLTKMLFDGGYLIIAVPDAEKFYLNFEEPFGEFSTEHINFFTASSLYQLMKNYSCLLMKSDNKVIYSVWKKGGDAGASLTKYISESEIKLASVRDKIIALPQKVLVWGAGSLTRRLMAISELKRKTVKLIDSADNLHAKTIEGIKVISPNEVYKYKEPILISSFRFKNEIHSLIKRKGFRNRIFTF